MTSDKYYESARRIFHAQLMMTVGVSLPWLVANLGYWRLSCLAYSIGLLLGLCALMTMPVQAGAKPESTALPATEKTKTPELGEASR